MQIVQNLATISLYTDDIATFNYLKSLLAKNFSKLLGKKNTIFSFFDENEIPQRKYFLKLLEKKYLKKDINLSKAYHKAFKLRLEQKNTLKAILALNITFSKHSIIIRLNNHQKLFLTYLKNYFKNHHLHYDENTMILNIDYKGQESIYLFEKFIKNEMHLNFYLDIKLDEKDFIEFKEKASIKESKQWKFNTLAKLFNSYFKTLGCSSNDSLITIRKQYLSLAKKFHPDFNENKNEAEKKESRKRFEQIQIAYDNLKALYKNNT